MELTKEEKEFIDSSDLPNFYEFLIRNGFTIKKKENLTKHAEKSKDFLHQKGNGQKNQSATLKLPNKKIFKKETLKKLFG